MGSVIGSIGMVIGRTNSAVVLTTEAQQTERALTALIALLLVVAAILAVLTVWYWRHTNPRRHMQRMFAEADHAGLDQSYQYDLDQPHYDDDLIDLNGSYEEAGQHYLR